MPMDSRIAVTLLINGQPRAVDAGVSISGLIADLGLTGKRIAVERNGEIVPRSRHADTILAAGDHIEVVAAVGGG
jgi:sulfur carrier protein